MMNSLALENDVMKKQVKGKLLTHASLAKFTSWRVGGPAKQLFFPADKEDVAIFLAQLPGREGVFWMGLGSNLLVRDGGIQGTVINTRSSLKSMSVDKEDVIYIEVGAFCAQVARFCSRQGFSGAEFLAGIPGTLGGALNMNAGAFGSEIWDIVQSVEMVSADGRLIKRDASEFTIRYRAVDKNPDEWFLSACLRLQKGNDKESDARIRDLLAKRAATQPLNQMSCGSVFKNPQGDYAARLIELSGLKGMAIGSAHVSEKHANFIINTGHATAAEIEQLIAYVRDEVERKQGIRLQTEVCIVGKKAAS